MATIHRHTVSESVIRASIRVLDITGQHPDKPGVKCVFFANEINKANALAIDLTNSTGKRHSVEITREYACKGCDETIRIDKEQTAIVFPDKEGNL